MSKLLTIILTISLGGFLVAVSYRNIREKRWKRLVLNFVIIGVAVFFLYRIFGFPQIEPEKKGPVEDAIAIALCYLCMISGMIAQYFYNQAQRGQKEFTFDLPVFLMPILVSPIVFIPLVSIIQEIPVDFGAFTKSKLMVYLVAFQNGFLWKDVFDRQRSFRTVLQDDKNARGEIESA